MSAIDKITNTAFWIDILVTFRSAYEDSESDVMVTIPHEIAWHYFKTWFLIDFFSVFPVAEVVEYIVLSNADADQLIGPTNSTNTTGLDEMNSSNERCEGGFRF